MSISGGEVYTLLRDAIVAAVVDQRTKEDRLTEWHGDPAELPTHDRHFALLPSEHPTNTEMSGCNQNQIVFELQVAYVTHQGWQVRMLDDGDALITAIWGLANTGQIVQLEEPLTSVTPVQGAVLYGRTIAIDYITGA